MVSQTPVPGTGVRPARLLLLVLALVGCTSTGTQPGVVSSGDADGPPARLSPMAYQRLLSQPDPIPRDEPLSERGNPPEYVVHGKRYRTSTSAVGYEAEGLASWYGRKFHGRLTSSGEPFDMFALTAAHRELPLPTYLSVTNLDNGRETIVRVNDRGPFHEQRVLDLSYGAAVKLGFSEKGTARVRMRALTGSLPPGEAPAMMATSQPPTVPQPAERLNEDVYFVQAGAFADEAAAEQLRHRLKDLLPGGERISVVHGAGWYRVRVGPLPTPEAATMVQWDLRQASLTRALVLAEPAQRCTTTC